MKRYKKENKCTNKNCKDGLVLDNQTGEERICPICKFECINTECVYNIGNICHHNDVVSGKFNCNIRKTVDYMELYCGEGK